MRPARREVGELQRHQQAHAHRRQKQADAHGRRLHDIEVDGVDAHPLRDREYDGDQHHGGRQALEHHAEHHGDERGAEQEQPVVILERLEHLAE